jgi:ribonuclease T2
MKQVQVGLSVLAGIAALAAIFAFGSPIGGLQSPNAPSAATKSHLPKGNGFDFYVLSLSWSPTYCQDSQARQRDAAQCSGPRPFAFVVHGLWPQFERGYPRSCQTTQNRPSQAQARAMLDIMPSERLVQHEWEAHGTCSGLSARDYLTVLRAAADSVAIPELYASAPQWRRVSAGDVEAAFVAANPELRTTGIGVAKRGNNLSEVRICLTLDLKPRACPEVDSKGVGPSTRLALPPSRGQPT